MDSSVLGPVEVRVLSAAVTVRRGLPRVLLTYPCTGWCPTCAGRSARARTSPRGRRRGYLPDVFPAAVDSRRSPALVRGCGADPAPPVPAHVGRISADLLQDQAADLPDALFSVAGPASMVDDVRTMPRSTGVARRRIRHVAPGHRWRNAP